MTGLQKIQAVADGLPIDVQPSLGYADESDSYDGLIVREPTHRDRGRAVLVEVPNPFSVARREGLDINAILKSDPNNQILERCFSVTEKAIRAAVGRADAVFYVLEGADPELSTPMQYGGYYLEKDRELLAMAMENLPTVLFVAGGEGIYMDSVSDLPATIFAWDRDASGISSSHVRSLRPGPQASSDPESEVRLFIESRVPPQPVGVVSNV